MNLNDKQQINNIKNDGININFREKLLDELSEIENNIKKEI